MYRYFTSESVAAGHPDKICDQVSDAIVDAALSQDPYSRVAVETLVTKNRMIIAGELTTKAKVNYKKVAQGVIKRLGYTNKEFEFSPESDIQVYIHEQSPEISFGVNEGGAGDQGMMFGYAVAETKNFMPLPISIAHSLVSGLDKLREEKTLPYLYPDGKSEVAVTYENGKPKKVEEVVLAVAANKKTLLPQLKTDLFKHLVRPVLEEFSFSIPENNLVVNGTGCQWTTPGPCSDTGVTGRKIIVDTYGGSAHVGGGCFSGKDPTKVDRSAAYAARFIAKNIVAAKMAGMAEVQLAYVIGQNDPLVKAINCFGTEKKKISVIEDFSWNLIDLSVNGILSDLNLRKPIYEKSASYGHFGRDCFPWEKIAS